MADRYDNYIEQASQAYKLFWAAGVLVHPLSSPLEDKPGAGKRCFLPGFQKISKLFPIERVHQWAALRYNFGLLCGENSNMTVIDVDWFRPGIWNWLIRGIDTSDWVFQRHGEGKEKFHVIFQYNPFLLCRGHQVLGFDILGQGIGEDGQIAQQNLVCSPSWHKDGTQYRIEGNLINRPFMPELFEERLVRLLQLELELKEVIKKCPTAFQKLWADLTRNKSSDKFRNFSGFLEPFDGRIRLMGFFAALKRNGASAQVCLLVCALIFGSEYNKAESLERLSKVQPGCTWRSKTIAEDAYFGPYYVPPEFDLWTIPLDTLEEKLRAEGKEQLLLQEMQDYPVNSIEEFEAVRRAFLHGYYACKTGADIE
jgi:putative DNA primase/helicase